MTYMRTVKKKRDKPDSTDLMSKEGWVPITNFKDSCLSIPDICSHSCTTNSSEHFTVLPRTCDKDLILLSTCTDHYITMSDRSKHSKVWLNVAKKKR